MARDIFETVSVISPGRTMFDLSYEKKFTCDMGQLIPILCEEAVPGDRWKIGMEALVRLNPQIFPLMHGVNVYVHYFFVPSRVLWDEWEEFITGGEDGESANVLPRWVPAGAEHAVGSLWDYLGYPTEVTPAGLSAPIDFGKRAYNAVWNAYYRDETHQAEVALTDSNILYRNWKKDYFTACLPWQQRGIAPAMPVSGITHAVWDPSIIQSGAGDSPLAGGTGVDGVLYVTAGGTAGRDHVRTFFNDNTVDLSAATTFNIADLRLAVQYQVWLERNARCGVRYTEFLHGHFGVSPRDDRLQRPEYIGGVKAPVIVSEVLQTSRSDTGETPLGTMGGHGISGAWSDGRHVPGRGVRLHHRHNERNAGPGLPAGIRPPVAPEDEARLLFPGVRPPQRAGGREGRGLRGRRRGHEPWYVRLHRAVRRVPGKAEHDLRAYADGPQGLGSDEDIRYGAVAQFRVHIERGHQEGHLCGAL